MKECCNIRKEERTMEKARIWVKTIDSIDYPSLHEVLKSSLMDEIKIIEATKKSYSSPKF